MNLGVPITVAGTYGPYPVPLRFFANGVGLIVAFAPGATGSVSVQVSGDDNNPLTQYWVNHNVLGQLSSSAADSLQFPCSQVRIVVSSVTPNSAGFGIHFAMTSVDAQPGW